MKLYQKRLMILMVSEQLKTERFNVANKYFFLGGKIETKLCYYKNERHALGTEWTTPYPDCMKCECSASAMSCCGYVVTFCEGQYLFRRWGENNGRNGS